MARPFFFFVLTLSLIGFLILSSAALGLLSGDGASYSRVVWNQFLALLLGLVAFLLVGRFPYRRWRPIAIWLFVLSILLTLLVFVPGLGFASGGARRWIALGSRTFQPAEFLKLGFIVYLAAWLAKLRDRVVSWQSGFLPFLLLVGLTVLLLVAQPDIGTALVLLTAATAMFFAAGANWRQIFLLLVIAIVSFLAVVTLKPYARERIVTFFYPDQKVESSAWQINQSLIAIGSGSLTGRGFGQSLQKFNYLPQPIGDSIFAVAAEEFGFLGGLILILAFTVFVIWGLRIAVRAPDHFGRLLTVGLVVLISTGVFINIASMLGLFPLTGIPLSFVSHGGSALFFTMVGCGMILNIARS